MMSSLGIKSPKRSPTVSANWLITGMDSRVKPSAKLKPLTSPAPEIVVSRSPPVKNSMIPFLISSVFCRNAVAFSSPIKLPAILPAPPNSSMS